MERSTILWTLVAFFGASVGFRGIQEATAGSPVLVTIALEVVLFAVIVIAIVAIVRRQD
ncbi:MAG: hypothetical protein QOH43_1210 [Solirubrobacteraceae bacterium]|jgi:hypothetical protein|nr:hypothetical protein [Solirubrobacteraceae bacterium]